MDKRLNTLKNWLKEELNFPLISINVASADASFRRYFRITIEETQILSESQQSLPSTMIVMDSPPEHEDNALFVRCTQVLEQCGLNIPTIFFKNLEQGFLVIKDLGTQTFDKELNENTADSLYLDAQNALITMQSRATNEKQVEQYSREKLQQEMSLFEDWYIKEHHQSSLNKEQQNSLSEAQTILLDSALEQEQVLVHRDYHCRNLLVTQQNNPGIIDYQDMVIGPITYDLVSLLRDCYIEWPNEKVEQWALDFKKLALDKNLISQTSDKQWLKWFDLMGVQRHLKVLGIFCRLYYRDGKDQYLEDLHLTHKYLVNICQKHSELQALCEILKQYPSNIQNH